VADVLTANDSAPGVPSALSQAASEASRFSSTGEMIKNAMPGLVKGAGYASTSHGVAGQGGMGSPGTKPLGDNDPGVMLKAQQATLDLRTETFRGIHQRSDVVKGLNQGFLSNFGYLKTALTSPSLGESLASMFQGGAVSPDLTRSFTAGNLGIGSVYGLVPFDLRAPSRLIYPVYTVYRNKLPRPPGQGTSMQERVFTGVSGSQTGGQGPLDISITELVSTGSATFSTWPLNLPGAGSQTEVNLNVPYRFFGLTEQLSWLAQFAGQGFEDISALANLILLQEMMLNEEYQLISGSTVNIATPASPTLTVRTAQSNETAMTGTAASASYYVEVVAVNYFGTTAASAGTAMTGFAAGDVVDVFITPSAGALEYQIYLTASSGASTGYYWATCGGTKYTLQGATPGATVSVPAADSGTGKSTRMEGIVPTLTGLSAQGGIYPATPVPWQGGYVNNGVGTHLSYNAIYAVLKGLWDSTQTSPGAFKADPAEIVSSGSDIANLSQDVISQGAGTNYELFIQQGDVGNVTVGAAVSQFQNPLTRSLVKLVVHPFYYQGNADILTYQLPQTWSNVANAWEMTCVQDYVSIAWPVIDATFRYSIFLFGALCAHAPQFSAHLGGLQQSDVTPYS
jgi:hypothetical protein